MSPPPANRPPLLACEGVLKKSLGALAALVVGWAELEAIRYDIYGEYFWYSVAMFFVLAFITGICFTWIAPGKPGRFLIWAVVPSFISTCSRGIATDQTLWPVGLAPAVVWFVTALAGARIWERRSEFRWRR